MSGESEPFVRRWSRLKRKSADAAQVPSTAEHKARAAPVTGEAPATAEYRQVANVEAAAAPPKVDLSALPSIESITADTDIRAFLQSGVPAEMTKAALRRVWTADPSIRDFIGIAENQWDFTDPNGIPGFGSLDATANVQDLVAQALGKIPEPVSRDEVAGATPVSGSNPPEPLPSDPSACAPAQTPDDGERGTAPEVSEGDDLVAPQQRTASAEPPVRGHRRSHGRAVPQ